MSSAKAVSFLAKKSWHTGTMRHMEKVWKAEERARVEDKKLGELRREKAEEREMEELRKTHENATGNKRMDKVDFLYQAPLLTTEPSAEDYLTGTRYKESDQGNDVKRMKETVGSLWLSTGIDLMNDKRAKIREDPLFAIKREEQARKTRLKDNPIKMKRLREEVERKERSKRRKISEEEYKKKSRRHRSSSRKQMTDEERQKKLVQMQELADKYEKERIERVNKYNSEDQKEQAQNKSNNSKAELGPGFINDMGKQVYTAKSTASLQDRLKRNTYYIQKTNLDEVGIFA